MLRTSRCYSTGPTSRLYFSDIFFFAQVQPALIRLADDPKQGRPAPLALVASPPVLLSLLPSDWIAEGS